MTTFPLLVEYDPDPRQSLEEVSSVVDLVLVQKGRDLWERWLRDGRLSEDGGRWVWNGEIERTSDSVPGDSLAEASASDAGDDE